MIQPSPPQFPTNLPGSFWGITTFFNPARYKNKYENYKLFRESSKKQGLRLLTVELAFGRMPFELKAKDTEILIQLRTNSVLWQKERLLNVGLTRLPDDCDKVAWLDCDILFKNDKWIEETSQLLEKYIAVQPFSLVVRLPKGASGLDVDLEKLEFGFKENQKRFSLPYIRVNNIKNYFVSPGHCWSARKEILQKCGIYDKWIVGSADNVMAWAFYGELSYFVDVNSLTKKMQIDQKNWADKVFSIVSGSVYYTDGVVLHLWHGERDHRLYGIREYLLKKYNFDPNKDIKIDKSGCWIWASDKPQLHKKEKLYFWIRNEEGSFLRSVLYHQLAERIRRLFQ